MEESQVKLTVIGVGNLLLKDEGIGVHIAHVLQQIDIPHGVKIIDGGTSPDLPYYLKGINKLIIMDAVKGGSQPGAIYRFHPHDVNIESEKIISLHELGLEQSLKMISLMGNGPEEIVIIGIEPKEIDWGTELSAELQQKMPEIVAIVLNEINSRLHD